MEYDEWTPLGRGDPLKNDPTYDYVPPVLDRVHYWVDPAARTPDPPLSTSSPPSSVVVLGSSNAKKTTPKPDTRKTPHADSRRDYYDPLVHFIDGPKFSSGGGRIRPQYIPVQNNYYSFRPPQRPPYTMLVPPPPGKPESYPVGSTAPAEFVYHTESTTATPSWEAGKTQLATLAPASSQPAKKPSDVVVIMETTTPLDANTLEYNREVSPMMEVIHAAPEESLPSSFLHLLLQNEVATTPTVSTTLPTITSSSSATSTTTTTTTTTPHPSLTTDPLFSHYKQPVEPLRGPMYLIIQGHSKVKTYGASKLDKISGIPVQDNNDVGEGHRRRTRQVDITDFIPVEETIEAVIRDYVDDQGSVGSGIGELLSAYS